MIPTFKVKIIIKKKKNKKSGKVLYLETLSPLF